MRISWFGRDFHAYPNLSWPHAQPFYIVFVLFITISKVTNVCWDLSLSKYKLNGCVEWNVILLTNLLSSVSKAFFVSLTNRKGKYGCQENNCLFTFYMVGRRSRVSTKQSGNVERDRLFPSLSEQMNDRRSGTYLYFHTSTSHSDSE